MGKTFHFLAGLHRSGNTVLSSILNQNPDIYSSPLGPICEYMWIIDNSDHESYLINTFENRKHNLISNMLPSYYSDVEKPIILDRDKNWGHPDNVKMLKKYISDKPKIIYTIRPVAEILASFLSIHYSGILKYMNDAGWKNNIKMSLEENMCEFLMNPQNQFARNISAINSIKDPENDGIFHIVRYEDLLNNPQETMDSIYKFLEVDRFDHDFNNIEKLEKYDDAKAGLPKDLHKIRKKLSRGDVDVNKYVSKQIQDKYSYIDDLFK